MSKGVLAFVFARVLEANIQFGLLRTAQLLHLATLSFFLSDSPDLRGRKSFRTMYKLAS